MKRRKKEQLNVKKEKKRKEWEKVQEFQEIEWTYDLINCHFDLAEYVFRLQDGTLGIDIKTAIGHLSCEKCSHHKMECKGKRLRGQLIVECLKEERHKNCHLGIIDYCDWELD